MEVILGIDIGGSTTKIVGLRTDGSVISMLRVRAARARTTIWSWAPAALCPALRIRSSA